VIGLDVSILIEETALEAIPCTNITLHNKKRSACFFNYSPYSELVSSGF
jgi:hypothetical protein